MADANNKKIGFFQGVKREFARISWPDRDTLTKETIAVVASSVVLGVLISIVDFFVKYGINLIIKK